MATILARMVGEFARMWQRGISTDTYSEYKITPIQNPTTGAAFENQPLSRLPLAAPLILQLDTWDRNGELIIP